MTCRCSKEHNHTVNVVVHVKHTCGKSWMLHCIIYAPCKSVKQSAGASILVQQFQSPKGAPKAVPASVYSIFGSSHTTVCSCRCGLTAMQRMKCWPWLPAQVISAGSLLCVCCSRPGRACLLSTQACCYTHMQASAELSWHVICCAVVGPGHEQSAWLREKHANGTAG